MSHVDNAHTAGAQSGLTASIWIATLALVAAVASGGLALTRRAPSAHDQQTVPPTSTAPSGLGGLSGAYVLIPGVGASCPSGTYPAPPGTDVAGITPGTGAVSDLPLTYGLCQIR